jgi:hypothetical protein
MFIKLELTYEQAAALYSECLATGGGLAPIAEMLREPMEEEGSRRREIVRKERVAEFPAAPDKFGAPKVRKKPVGPQPRLAVSAKEKRPLVRKKPSAGRVTTTKKR